MAVDETDPVSPGRLPSPSALGNGETFGAYRIIRMLGKGGMGEVYLAHDGRLDRLVAIKVVNALTWGEFGEVGRARLTREALALAKLSHPNIVAVFEIGAVREHVFVAMEYVEGGTLSMWLAETKRSLREILDLFVQAGRGLAAAHGQRLVHRDFKPDNILVDTQGRARVSDFGLVTGAGVITARGDETVTRGSLGTPAYMPPEQHDGGTADARSDQYAFCVSLWEAIHGRRPFSGTSSEDLQKQKREVQLREESSARLPAPIRAAILRGLSPDPARRFPSMQPLLDILVRDRGAARRRVAAMVGTALVAGAAVFVALRAAAPEQACLGAERKLVGVWDPGVKDRIRTAFAGSARTYAGPTFERVSYELDRYAHAWTAMRRDACVATAVRREQSEAVLDLRMQCLDGRLRELDALANVYARADAAVVDRAVQAVGGLSPVSTCADTAALAQVVPPPADPGVRLAAAMLRSRLAVARASLIVGRFRDGLPLARALVDEARALGATDVLAESLATLADLQRDGDRAASLATTREALLEAAKAHDDAIAARAWTTMVAIVGTDQGRFDEALLLEPGATAAVARAGNPPRLRVRLLKAVAVALGNRGQLARAREQLDLGLRVLEPLPDAATDRAGVLSDMAIWLRKEGKLAEAADAAERSLALFQQHLGEDHPQCAVVLSNLGLVAVDAGDFARSEQYLRRSLAIAESALGQAHPQLARTLNNLGLTLLKRGENVAAREAHERALAIQEKALGPDHVELAITLNNLGNLQMELADTAGARRSQERALRIQERAGDVRATWSLFYLGEVCAGERDFERARSYKRQAIEQWTKTRGPDHPVVADALSSLARIELQAGRLDAALEQTRRALAVREKSAKDHRREQAAETDLLGDVLGAMGKHEEALARHEEALAILGPVVAADDLALAAPLTGVGEAHLDLGRPGDAVAPLSRAVALRGDGKGGPIAVARTRFALARALWASGGDRARATVLARQSLDALATLGPAMATERTPITAWVRAHP